MKLKIESKKIEEYVIKKKKRKDLIPLKLNNNG